MAFGKTKGPEPGSASPQQAAARAEQLAAGVAQATTALRTHDAKAADAALAAGQRLAEAASALAGALARRAGGDGRIAGTESRVYKEAEDALRRGIEVLHRLHFQIIRVDLQDDVDAASLPLEDAERAATEIHHLADRLGTGDAP